MKSKFLLKLNLYWVGFFILIFIKNIYYYYEYFPILDDWIQYGVYSLGEETFYELIRKTGIYYTRPLAMIFDFFVWGKFWGNMRVVLLVITCLHFFSGYFLYKVFKYNNLPVGNVFLIIYYLLPLGSEATYWISASSRNIVGIFFMSIALFVASNYIKYQYVIESRKYIDEIGDFFSVDNSRRKIPNYMSVLLVTLFFIISLISFGFYEPIIILGVSCSFILLLFNIRRLKNKIIILVPFINFILVGVYYWIFNEYNSRTVLLKGDYLEHYYKVTSQISAIWIEGNNLILFRGAIRGINQIFEDGRIIFGVSILLIIYYITKIIVHHNFERTISESIVKIFLGSFLFIIPYIIYFFIDYAWISNRNAFTSFVGLAIILDGVFGYLSQITFKRKSRIVVLAFIISLFIFANISELTDYKRVSQIDRILAKRILEKADDNLYYNGDKKAYILNSFDSVTKNNFLFHEHIINSISSDWGLTGSLRAYAKTTKISMTYPIKNDSIVYIDPIEFEERLFFGVDNYLNIYKLDIRKSSNKEVKFYTEENIYFGRLVEGYKRNYLFEVDKKFIINKVLRPRQVDNMAEEIN